MALMQHETVQEALVEVADQEAVSHLSKFAIDLLTPNGGANMAPTDMYPNQLKAFVDHAIESTEAY